MMIFSFILSSEIASLSCKLFKGMVDIAEA